ncbi:MAG: DeoR/GlpR family DNA-binding transcription regulator [Actinomycetaceae bacterium]|nr:DeoR/GlpR family DNA-binding transcription regulator [Actinomycetaceae bacterium]
MSDNQSLQKQTPDQVKRRRQIASTVLRRGAVSIDELSEQSGVSPMTVYRDIAVLERAGVLYRNRGKVVAAATGLHEATARYRITQEAGEKKAMALVAAALVPPGSSVLIDDSTSAIWVLRELVDMDMSPLSVVTNSLLVASELQGNSKHTLMMLGGEYQAWAEATMGPVTISNLDNLRADMCLISASGVHDSTVYHPYADVAAVKNKMLKAAEHTILLLDHTKFKRRALYAFGTLDDVDTVIVDSETDQQYIDSLKEHDLDVVVAQV